jgi:nitrate reductase (cytochrome), electron transfer subunit
MNKFAIIVSAMLLAGIVGCASAPVESMRAKDVEAADMAPDMKQYSEKSPGGVGPQILIPRTFAGQPPLIPHTAEKYEPITREENDCLECHVSDELNGRKMPRMGDSHFVKLDKSGKAKPVVSMARWNCTQCHVPQVDAKPLVENRFVGNISPR